MSQQFTSDNTAGMCPEALQAFIAANETGHEDAYGEDTWTAKVCDRIREVFECDAEVFFVFNGTAANSLVLAAMCQSYHSVICHQMAHVDNDECGAPGFFSGGSTLLVSDCPDGKLTPQAIKDLVAQRDDIHYPKPKAVSLTQATECGTVYSVEELQAIGKMAKGLGLHVHMDGARFANAVASLNVPPADITWKAGVDALVFGGAKNGLPMGEAIVIFNKDLATDFAYRLKQAGQLASKMRFISAPWLGVLENDVWLKNARHANTMAKRLLDQVKTLNGVKVMFEPQANGVFLGLDTAVQEQLRARGWTFLVSERGCRFMCSWDLKKETVDRFCQDLKELCSKP